MPMLKFSKKKLIKIIKNRLPFDLLSIELRDGIQNLSKITGQELTEELLDNIFSKFCIGK